MENAKELYLLTSDLVIDAVYHGYKTENGGYADPLVRLVGVSRQGGFRYRGTRDRPTVLVLYSTQSDPDWPDELDTTTGRFVYYGDNKKPGQKLHDTQRFGNELLIKLFEIAHTGDRANIPPILIFTSAGAGRAYRFRGLAVPGHPSMPATEDLVAIWKSTGGIRFQNYRATFTILDASVISRGWIDSIKTGAMDIEKAPDAWRTWVETGVIKPLIAPRTQLIRTREEQLPSDEADLVLIDTIRTHYANNSYGFEACAGELARLLLGNVSRLDLTRPWRDGGRDALGALRLGRGASSIEAMFALEAKCYGIGNSIGVREVSRLISRIKHREFGILITTSFVNKQAYQEVVDDGHPVIFVTAIDIVQLLRASGYGTAAQLSKWLDGI
ncbi:restriction endonuclease [Serratia sp. JSRIV001]|uniref:restriction endonuclease n=1 Tax=Serratia sp. JSRIV001 TaxID=2831893 RepID=UPI001CBEEE73|nr:restriction endonuclease [Serratia sp. JSRIV001]UAN46068.1 restriction endonuclease [Serratia sp. JSRIV001]